MLYVRYSVRYDDALEGSDLDRELGELLQRGSGNATLLSVARDLPWRPCVIVVRYKSALPLEHEERRAEEGRARLLSGYFPAHQRAALLKHGCR